MWGEIILALGPSVLEAIGTKLLDRKNKTKVLNKLNDIVSKQFDCFADSSLDSDGFYTLIKSTRFVEIIRNYFFMVRDNQSIEDYRANIEALICDECKSANILDVKEFVRKIEALYIDFLSKIIEDYPGIYVAFQLMSISHREIISNIRGSQNELKRYLATLENRKDTISDENIRQYHTVTEKEFGEIRFTGIAGAERRKAQNINEFYVENTFSYFGKEIDRLYEYNDEEIESIKLKDFFDLGNKIILIGGAGLGKSTTLNYLFCNYEKLYDATALKLKIDLKEYAEEIGEKKKGVLWCVANEFRKRIKYAGQTTEELQAVVAEKLNSGACLVILDALDEIPTQALRDTVRNDIAYLNNEFKKAVLPLDSSGLLYNANELFLTLKGKNKKAKNDIDIIKFFTEEGIEYTLKYPQVFVAVISLSIKTNTPLPIEQLLRYDFSPRNVFYNYTSPDILISLVENAMKTKDDFALFLTAVIDCALQAANSICNFVISNRSDSRDKAVSCFYAQLWRVLNESSSVDGFKGWIKELGLFDEKYDYLYEKLYAHYSSTEKGLYDERIKKFIKKENIN